MTRTRRFFKYLIVWTIFAVALASVPDPASAQNRAYRIQLIPLTGTTLDGTQEFQVSPTGHANLTESGDVLFDSNEPISTVNRALGLWSGDNVTILESLSNPAPPPGGVVNFYPFFLSRPNNNGDVTFISEFGLNSTVADHGLWAGPPSQLELIARSGDPAPGTPGLSFLRLRNDPLYDLANVGTYGGFLNDAGDLVFRAAIGDPAACIPDCGQQLLQEGLWRHSPFGLELLAQSGDPAPGLTGENFTTFPSYVLNGAGDVVFVAETSTLSLDDRLGDGLWAGQAGSLRPVAVRGQAAPGTGGLTFTGFRSGWFSTSQTSNISDPSFSFGPVTNSAGDIGFFALSDQRDGIWTEQAGVLRPLAIVGNPAPGTGDGVYQGLSSRVDLNEAGQFAFAAGFLSSATSAIGLWVGDPDALNLVVSTDDVAPGFTPSTFERFGTLDLNLSGDVAFDAVIQDIELGQAQGVWVGGTGGISSVLRHGDAIEVAPGDIRTVDTAYLSSFLSSDNGESRAMNDAGQISLLAFVRGLPGTLLIATPIDPAAPNGAPIAEAGPDQAMTAGQFLVLDASGSTDAEGTPLFFSWSAGGVLLGDGPRISIQPALAPGTHTVTLTVTDQQGLSATDTMTLTVNARPVADAGPDQTVSENQGVLLDGTGSFDPDGDTLTYSWEQNGIVVASTATAAVGPFGAGTQTFTLTVSDPDGASSSDTVVITMIAVTPVANAGPDQTVSNAQSVLLDGTGSSDPNGDTLTYSWEQNGIVIASTAIATVGPFGAGTQTFTLTVYDPGGASSSDTVVITTIVVAPVADAGPDQIVGEGAVFSLDGSASFDPEGGALTYTWSLGGTVIATGATATVGPLPPGLHIASLRVTDPQGDSASDTVFLDVIASEPINIAGAIKVPGDQATIQNAIDVAVNGDTVLVSPGTYVETLNYQGKAITLISEFGPALTVIEGSVIFDSGEGLDSVLQGFTVRDGGGISITGASPKVIGNRIFENSKCSGAGININFGSPIIQDNIISGNTTTCSGGNGGGMYVGGAASAQILDNVITNNVVFAGDGGGIFLNAAGTPTIRGNRIEGNRVGGISPAAVGGGIGMINRSDALIVQNVIVGNIADNGGGVSWLISGRGPYLVNNTIADNSGAQVVALGFSAQVLLINNTVSGTNMGIACDPNPPILLSNNAVSTTGPAYSGLCANALGVDGNISADPLFVDAANGNYRLQSVSPLVDAGDNSAPGLPSTDGDGRPRFVDGDIDGIARVDMGAFEFGPGPVANAGPDQEVTDLDTVVLDGTGSSDPAGGILTYDWSVDGTALAAGPTPSVGRLPLGTHAITLTVTDTEGATASDIVTITVLNHAPLAGTVVELPLNEGSGTIAGDISGFFNHGTLAGGAAYEAATADRSAFSVRFDGVDDFIDLGVVDVTGTGLTLAAWFNADSFPGSSSDPRLISKAAGTAANDHVFMLSTIRVGSAVRLRARVRVGGSTTTLIANSGDLVPGVWQHAAVTYDGATLRLYLDGVGVGSTSLVGAVDVAPTVSVAIGGQPPGAGPRFFDGLLDDVRILQRAMSGAEISGIVSVGAGNQLPVAADDGYATPEDFALVVVAANGVLANDTDPDLDPLQTVLVDDVSNGVLTLNADGSFDYTPAANFNGTDSFTYRASDGRAQSNLATVTLTVGAVSDVPVAADDQYQTQPDTALTVNVANGVLSNDSDPDLDPLQAVLVSDVTNGALILNPDGSFGYTPFGGFSGQDSFTYQANDGFNSSNLATVTISVTGSLDPDALVSLPLDDGSGLIAGDVSGMGNDGMLAGGAAFDANTADGSAFSVRFDGVDGFIDLGAVDVSGTGLTLAARFNADSFPGSSSDPRLISKATGTASNDHVFMLSTIRVGSAVRLRARVRVGGSTTTLIAGSGDLLPGVWQHAAVTYDGAALRLYLDAVEVGSTPLSGAVDVAPSVPVTIGAQPPGAGPRYFDGLLDDVRILQRALSAAEVNQIVAGGT